MQSALRKLWSLKLEGDGGAVCCVWKEFERPAVTTAMAKDQDDEDYIVYGTPLEREEELGPRKRKEALDQGQARRVAPWNQEVSQFFDRAMQRGPHKIKKNFFFLSL